MFAQTPNSDRQDHDDPLVTQTASVARRKKSSTSAGIVAGLSLTVAFYLVAPLVGRLFSGGEEFVTRYFCGHPLEYITSAMFFVGLGILWTKLRLLPRERRAIASLTELAIQETWSHQESRQGVHASLRQWLRTGRASGAADTNIGLRLLDVDHYISSQKGTARTEQGIEDHLRYLSDLAADRLLQSYSLIRTITWAVPIMGFLGTVVGITMAIANVTPEQLDTSLPEVTAGLAVAFDTTAQALGMSMILVFGTFLVERGEQTVLNETEQFGIDHLVPAFASTEEPSEAPQGIPGLAAWTAEMLKQQTEFWNSHLTSLQTGWADSLAHQTQTLAAALADETEQTLALHRDSLSVARDQSAAVLHENSRAVSEQLQTSLALFSEKMDAWQNALQVTTLSAAEQTEELHRLGRTLLQMTEAEQRLVQIQDQLNQNLQSLQIVETLEQTVNSLNAAVSLLSAKISLRSAA